MRLPSQEIPLGRSQPVDHWHAVPSTDIGRARGLDRVCMLCGVRASDDRSHCGGCGGLLEDPASNAVHLYASGDDDEAGTTAWWRRLERRTWSRLAWGAAFGIATVALVVWRVVAPTAEELAADRAHREALKLLGQMETAPDLSGLVRLAGEALAPRDQVEAALDAVGSADGTRPRLDGYWAIFSGVYALRDLEASPSSGWSRARRQLESGQAELQAIEPEAGVLRTQVRAAVARVDDLVWDRELHPPDEESSADRSPSESHSAEEPPAERSLTEEENARSP